MRHKRFVATTLFLICSCKSDPAPQQPTAPKSTIAILTTTNASEITATSVVSGGTISSDGGAAITSRGVCYSENSATLPTVSDSKTIDGTGTGNFKSILSTLVPGKTYNARAYAENSVGIAYGNVVTFVCSPLVIPVVVTSAVTGVNFPTSISGGTITTVGTFPITTKGVCWKTSTSPTVNDSKTTDGEGSNAFVSMMTGLDPVLTYYVRAYVVSNNTVTYGNQLKFTGIVDADMNFYSTVTIGTQVWLLENLNTSKYANGETIPFLGGVTPSDNQMWSLMTSAFSTSQTSQPTYGRLYNWYAVADPRKVCPSGYHIPSQTEFTTLINFLGGNNVASPKLRETGSVHWSNNNAATNSSGFTALPGGTRHGTSGAFQSSGTMLALWTTAQSGNDALYYQISTDFTDVVGVFTYRNSGTSVRCLKD